MIVPMQKVVLLISEKQLSPALLSLRSLGVLHVEHVQPPSAEGITALEHRLNRLDKVLNIVGDVQAEPRTLKEEEISSCINELLSLDKARQTLLSRLEELSRRQAWFEQWGDISAHTLADMEKRGVYVKLYVCDRTVLKKVSGNKFVHIVSRRGNDVLCALISRSAEDSLEGRPIALPHGDMHQTRRKIELTRGALETIDKWINTLCGCRHCFMTYRQELLKHLEFFKVRFGMRHQKGFSLVQGYCPGETLPSLRRKAGEQGWGLVSQEPDDPQQTPTLIRTPAWLKIIQPVFGFMGTVPGYNEFDISFWFLLFFSLFFAMLIGDAGYGLVFLAAAHISRRKFKTAPREPFILTYVLGGATLFWGAITGTWFGFEKIAQLPLFRSLVIPTISSFGPDNQDFMMQLCFLIGVIHLSIAHGLIALRWINNLRALSQIGWICILWGLFFVAGNLVLARPLSSLTVPLLVAGASLVLFFSNPQKNVLKGVLTSLADLPLSVISSFSDIVSYLRLFAVGYASVIVAVSFNEMAHGIPAVLILVAGHALNIVLGLMAIIVHGIRLNMLEFSGHLNMQWSGKKYEPFRE